MAVDYETTLKKELQDVLTQLTPDIEGRKGVIICKDKLKDQEFVRLNNNGVNWYAAKDPDLLRAIVAAFREQDVEVLKHYDIWDRENKKPVFSPVTDEMLASELAKTNGIPVVERRARELHKEMQTWGLYVTEEEISRVDIKKIRASLEAIADERGRLVAGRRQ